MIRALRRRVHQVSLRLLRRRFSRLSRAQAFSAIYRERRWGQPTDTLFDSGSGSTDVFAADYCRIIQDYMAAHRISSIVDLGCGDFRIGRRLAAPSLRYCGVDIVSELVEHNRVNFGSGQVTFRCRDIVNDPLPDGDLCLLRQVLQHLSNDEILMLLPRLSIYPHVIVTEHVPRASVPLPNLDKPHGPDTRLPDGSGVFLDLPPFCCRVSASWDLPCDNKSKMRVVALAGEHECES